MRRSNNSDGSDACNAKHDEVALSGGTRSTIHGTGVGQRLVTYLLATELVRIDDNDMPYRRVQPVKG